MGEGVGSPATDERKGLPAIKLVENDLNTSKPLIFCVVGTRPEAVKMAPVVAELRRFPEVETRLVSTGQHKEILLQALATFGLAPTSTSPS